MTKIGQKCRAFSLFNLQLKRINSSNLIYYNLHKLFQSPFRVGVDIIKYNLARVFFTVLFLLTFFDLLDTVLNRVFWLPELTFSPCQGLLIVGSLLYLCFLTSLCHRQMSVVAVYHMCDFRHSPPDSRSPDQPALLEWAYHVKFLTNF